MMLSRVTFALSDPVLDGNHTITMATRGGLEPGTRVYSGLLSDEDVTRQYRINVPYISDPYLTMDQTSRQIARRFTAIGGPSFFVSVVGQESLQGELMVNTTFDRKLDWSNSEPKLAYWDIGEVMWMCVCVCVCVLTE